MGNSSTASKASRANLINNKSSRPVSPKKQNGMMSTLEDGIKKEVAETQRTPMANKTGIKRPTTAMNTGISARPQTAQAHTVSVGSSSSKMGTAPSLSAIAKAKDVASRLRKPSEMKNSVVEKKDEVNEIEEVVKKTPVKLRHSIAPAGPKSAEKDELDSIYDNIDPIFSSLDIRKKAGNIS